MKFHPTILCLALSFTLLSAGQNPQPAIPKEYQIKAVFLFNFTQFVEWPVVAFADQDAPFLIGVVGHDPFGSYLDEAVRGEKIMGHPFVIRRFQSLDEVESCHILFISESDKVDIKRAL
ncbi:MAG: DUF4154 domain-containing protein, partial [Marivirga sp.]|nr:DUF4154 domain-containing protein [Marivirga sp.]